MSDQQTTGRGAVPVLRNGAIIGYTVRVSAYEVKAVRCGEDGWGRPDLCLGVFKDRSKAAKAVANG